MNIPADLKYTKDHEWVRINGTEATIGITDFAQNELGDIVYVDIPSVGEHVSREAIFGTVEAVKTVSDLFMPLSGTVNTANTDIDQHPESVNKDPYGSGWMITITISNPEELSHLLDADAYKSLIGL